MTGYILLGVTIYLCVGMIFAMAHDNKSLSDEEANSAALKVTLLWPLILVGWVSLRILLWWCDLRR